MKHFRNIGIALFMALMPACAATCGTTVEAGHVGILVDSMAGGDTKDAFTTVNGPDMVWVGPYHTLYDFDTTAQTYQFTDSPHEGSQTPEAFQFQTTDGSIIHAPIQIQFHVPKDNVVKVFKTYRRSLNEVRANFLRNSIREALNENTSGITVQDALGPRKNEIMTATATKVRDRLAIDGIVLDSLNLMGAFIPPESFTASINAKNVAQQKALEIQNEVASSTAQAQKNVVDAEGQAKAIIARAKGDAEARRIQAEAEATANRLISASITPTLVEYRRVEKWNGQQPHIVGGVGTTLMLDARAK